jgi:hypothetical protein
VCLRMRGSTHEEEQAWRVGINATNRIHRTLLVLQRTNTIMCIHLPTLLSHGTFARLMLQYLPIVTQ